MKYEEKDILLETAYWQPETSGAKNTYSYLIKFIVVEYETDKDLRFEIEFLFNNNTSKYFFMLPKDKTRIKIKLPLGRHAQRWKVKVYNLEEKPKEVILSYIGVLGIPMPIGDRFR